MSFIIIIHMDNSFKWHNIDLFENTFLQDMQFWQDQLGFFLLLLLLFLYVSF